MHKTIDFIGDLKSDGCFKWHTPSHGVQKCQKAFIVGGFQAFSMGRLCNKSTREWPLFFPLLEWTRPASFCSLAGKTRSVIAKVIVGVIVSCAGLACIPLQTQAQSLQQSMIWSPSSPAGTQVYRAFRKSFVLATNPPQASLQIFADSRYILWVNGRYVLRGPCRFDWHGPQYDTVDISSFLQAGTNVLAVMVHSYEHVTSKIMIHNPGLTAELQLPGTNIFTGTTWRSGPTIFEPSADAWGSIPDVIDARVQTNDWTATNFNDSAWETATNVDGTQWGALTPRTIPLAQETVMTNVTLLPFGQNLAAAFPITLTPGQQILVNLGRMDLAYAAVDLNANANSVLQITYYLRLVNGQPGETYGVGTTYTARSGRQSFITGDEWGCHYASLQCTSGQITLYGLTMTDRRYPFTRVGQFSCSDIIFNQLWTNAVNTIELTSDDGYGADARERNEWLQDPAQPNFITTRVSEVSSNADGSPVYSDPRLLKSLMLHDSYTPYQTGDGRLKAHACSDRFDVHGYIEDYSCQWVESLRLYYDVTGDTNFVNQMWPALTNQMAWFLNRRTSDGLVLAREYTSFDNALAYITCEGARLNAFIYQALNDSAYLGNAIGLNPQASSYSQAATNLATAFEQKLWNASASTYNSGILNGQTLGSTTHAALIALDRGIVPTNHLASVRNWFLANYKNPGTFNVSGNPNYLNWIQQVVGINMPVSYYWVFNQLYQIISLRPLIPEHQLVTAIAWVVLGLGFGNQFCQRGLLKCVPAQNLQNWGQAEFQSPFLAHHRDQHINADRNPDLGLDGVVGRAEEVLDAQVLLDPLEKQFHLPAAFVELGNEEGRQVEVIGQEHQDLPGLRVFIANPAQAVGIVFGAALEGESHPVVAAHACAFSHRERCQPVEANAGLGAVEKDRPRVNEPLALLEIQIATVQHIESPGFKPQPVQRAHLGLFAVRDRHPGWDGPAQIQQRVKFAGRLGGPQARPREQAQAQVDGGCIESVNSLV